MKSHNHAQLLNSFSFCKTEGGWNRIIIPFVSFRSWPGTVYCILQKLARVCMQGGGPCPNLRYQKFARHESLVEIQNMLHENDLVSPTEGYDCTNPQLPKPRGTIFIKKMGF